MRLNTTLMTSAALAALLATTPVLAQDTTTDTNDETVTEEVMPEAEVDTDLGADVDADVDADLGNDTGVDADVDATTDMNTDGVVEIESDAMLDSTADAALDADVMAPEGYAVADLTTFTVDQLLGVDIYGPAVNADGVVIEGNAEGEFIGNITDLVLADDQAVAQIITDVGGFLGIGQRSVAIPAEDFTLFSDADGNLRGHVTMNREQIEALPEYVAPME